MRFEMWIGSEPAIRRADSAKSDTAGTQNRLQCVFATRQERPCALLANESGTHSRQLGTCTVVVNCIHANCIRFNEVEGAPGGSYTPAPGQSAGRGLLA